jgi:hypothetical protein
MCNSSIKLLTEQYLKGTVSFTSVPDAGTTFTAHFPKLFRRYLAPGCAKSGRDKHSRH